MWDAFVFEYPCEKDVERRLERIGEKSNNLLWNPAILLESGRRIDVHVVVVCASDSRYSRRSCRGLCSYLRREPHVCGVHHVRGGVVGHA
jgi:hypothetical protein